MLYSILLRTRLNCPNCGEARPIEALTDKLMCPTCNQTTPISWGDVTKRLIAKYSEGQIERHLNGASVGGVTGAWILSAQAPPTCLGCGGTLGLNELRSALNEKHVGCVDCGRKFHLRRPPPAIAENGIEFIIGENADALESVGPSAQILREPAVMHCPNCGAALEADGSVRKITCSYCSTGVVMPDALWERLHSAQFARGIHLAMGSAHHHQLVYGPGSTLAARDAANPGTPADALEYLARHGDEAVQLLVASNPNTPDGVAINLLRQGSSTIQEAILKRAEAGGATEALARAIEERNARLEKERRDALEAARHAEEERARKVDAQRAEREAALLRLRRRRTRLLAIGAWVFAIAGIALVSYALLLQRG